jgi:MbtH protein
LPLSNPLEGEATEYVVVVNHEEQYSLWPGFREVPAGWTAVGPKGSRAECLAWIEENWTDMAVNRLPRSVQEFRTRKRISS